MTVYNITFTGGGFGTLSVGDLVNYDINSETSVSGTITALTGTASAGTLTGNFVDPPNLGYSTLIFGGASWEATMTSFEEAAGPVSGTLAVTLAASTLAAAGTTTITGTLAVTLAASTLAAAADTTVTGTLALTLADSTLAASGDVESGSTGTLAVTLDASTLAAAGDTTVTGTLAVTLDASTLAAAGDTGALPQDDHNPGGGSRTFVGLPVRPPRQKKIDEELEAILASLLLLT